MLTFDDGRYRPIPAALLDILASECVKATFFLVGQMAKAHPGTVRQIHAAGHTIGTHSNSHPFTFHRMTWDKRMRRSKAGSQRSQLRWATVTRLPHSSASPD